MPWFMDCSPSNIYLFANDKKKYTKTGKYDSIKICKIYLIYHREGSRITLLMKDIYSRQSCKVQQMKQIQFLVAASFSSRTNTFKKLCQKEEKKSN